MSIISLVTDSARLYAEWDLGPRRIDMGFFMTSRFLILRSPGAAQADSVVSMVSLARAYQVQEGWGSDSMAHYVAALAPHVLIQSIISPDSLPMRTQHAIDLDTWCDSKGGFSVPLCDLAAYLDDGKVNYRRICRGDVLQILLEHYDGVGAHDGLVLEQVLASPLKRRFYEPAIVKSVINTLEAERLVLADPGEREQWRVNPERIGEVRAEVAETTRGTMAASTNAVRAFAPGERFPAWEELRGLLKSAQHFAWLEDAYLGSDVVALLGENLHRGVVVRVLGPVKDNSHWRGALATLKIVGADRPGEVEVRRTGEVHDRFIYVDDRAWRCTESFKDMAKTRTTKIIPEQANASACADFEKRWSGARKEYAS